MKGRFITAYLIDMHENEAKVVTIEDELEPIYKAIHCDTIDIVQRIIDGKLYHIVLDDNGKLHDDAIISALHLYNPEILVGSLLIAGLNYEQPDELGTLTDDDILLLKKHIKFYKDGDITRPVVILD